MNPACRSAAAALLALAAATSMAADVVVNRVLLDSTTRQALERTYGVPIAPGRY